jgi:hypothetical protein
MNSLIVIRFISTGLLVLSLVQFIGAAIHRYTKRIEEVPVTPGSSRTIVIKAYAGHTWEQRAFQTAIVESVIGTIMLIVTKFL